MRKSQLEETFAQGLADLGLPAPVSEYKFHPERKWRFDFCWPALWLAVEVEGQGRHQTWAGFHKDTEKYAEAMLLGWRVLRVGSGDVTSGRAAEWTWRAICEPGKGVGDAGTEGGRPRGILAGMEPPDTV